MIEKIGCKPTALYRLKQVGGMIEMQFFIIKRRKEFGKGEALT